MGFLQGVYALKEFHSGDGSGNVGSPLEDLDDFIEFPLPPPPERKEAKPGGREIKEIRVLMDVEDAGKTPFVIRGIESLVLGDYDLSGEDEEVRAKRWRYLYRKPAGANVSWSYSPLYKLGKGMGGEKALSELGGKGGDWRNDPDSRLYKLHKAVLQDYEKSGFFSSGSAEILADALWEKREKLASLWNDPKSSYLLIFGLESEDGRFLFPGDIPLFVDYFRCKMEEQRQKKGSENMSSVLCAYCGTEEKQPENLSGIFKFATFDKKGFLPGLNDGEPFKVFPLCQGCYATFSSGRRIMDGKYLYTNLLRGINIYVLPELLLSKECFESISRDMRDFFLTGLPQDTEDFFDFLASEEQDVLVFHFLFWEQLQAQERLHLMVEDVPPSRLRKLYDAWERVYQNHHGGKRHDKGLDGALRYVVRTFLEMGKKSDSEKKTVQGYALEILGRLLGGLPVEVLEVKRFFLSRLRGLAADPEWVREGRMHYMVVVCEFLCEVNKVFEGGIDGAE